MAEAQVALDTNNDRGNHYSRPVFKQVLKVNSLQAQRVMERSFERVSNSLFSIDVILRIIGEQEEIDQVETVILEHISKVSEDLDKATAQLNKLMEDNGIDMMPGYTNPNEYTIEINSPQVAQFAHLIRKLDTLMGIVDTLWLNTVLTSKQRTDATYQWQQRLIKLAGRMASRNGLAFPPTAKAKKVKWPKPLRNLQPATRKSQTKPRKQKQHNPAQTFAPRPRGFFLSFMVAFFDAVILSK
ncbi:hypothetical protein ACS6JE_19865 [Enterobacter hormaechei subsp. steigerwaltii]|uniref:hypothetical protein n=1 Tax=Enterobacter hormaechei TaxID=158836 RepID=UPI003F440223